MGLFSSKYKTTVGTVVNRVIPDGGIPNSVRTGALKSIFDKDGGDIPGFVMEELVTSVALRAERMYTYGRDHYTHGIPSGQTYTATQGRAQVEFLLGTIEGAPVTVDYYRYGAPNNLHIAWIKLIAEQGYNPTTNQLAGLSTAKGVPVYLKDVVVVLPTAMVATVNPVALEQWGLSPKAGNIPNLRVITVGTAALVAHSPVVSTVLAVTIHARVNYVWTATGSSTVSEESLNITLNGYIDEADYYQVKYTIGGVVKYWMYRAGAGNHIALDDLFDVPPVAGTYFPFAYFRYNKVSEITGKTTQAYLTSRKLVKYLGMDYDTVAGGIDENPGIADVEQAMLVMAVPANTTHELERRYLFEYFDAQYTSLDNPYRSLTQAQIDARLQANPDLAKTSTVIQDARFKMALSNGGIFKKRVVGNIGVIGSHSSGLSYIPLTTTVEVIGESTTTYSPVTTNVSLHYYRQQISNTLYDEIQVYDLEMLYHIYGEYTATGDEADNILLIPLDRSITSEYSLPDREILYSRSLHYVFNSRVITEVKWYQQSWFSAFMLVVAIVLTVITYGATWQAVAAQLVAGTMTIGTFLMTIAIGVLKYLIITVAVRLFIKEVGAEAAFIAAIVAAAVGIFNDQAIVGFAGTPWTMNLLQLSSGISAGIQTQVKDLFTDLMGEGTDFIKYVKEQTKLLEEANKLLETNNFLSPFVIFGESPTDYYNRTVHSGNIGVVAIDAVSSFVETQLALPKLNDSLGYQGGR